MIALIFSIFLLTISSYSIMNNMNVLEQYQNQFEIEYTELQNQYALDYALQEAKSLYQINLDYFQEGNDLDGLNDLEESITNERLAKLNASAIISNYMAVLNASKGLPTSKELQKTSSATDILAFGVITPTGLYMLNRVAFDGEDRDYSESIQKLSFLPKKAYISNSAAYNMLLNYYHKAIKVGNNYQIHKVKMTNAEKELARVIISKQITTAITKQLVQNSGDNFQLYQDVFLPIYNSEMFGNNALDNIALISITRNLRADKTVRSQVAISGNKLDYSPTYVRLRGYPNSYMSYSLFAYKYMGDKNYTQYLYYDKNGNLETTNDEATFIRRGYVKKTEIY